MNTRLTVAEARANLYTEVNAGNANDPKFLRWLNEVCERYTWSGKWKGAIINTVFSSATGYVTLGPDFYAALANRWGRWPGNPTFSQFHPYMEMGPGELRDAVKFPGLMVDMGDGFPTTVSIAEASPGSIRIYSGGSDNGKTMRLYGTQEESGEPIFDAAGVEGEEITLNAPFVTSANHYSELTGVERETTKGYVTLKLLPQGGGTEYVLSTYRPNETRPMYRRYQVGTFDEATDGQQANLHIICQRRFTLMRDETDWVIPGNLSALRYGLKMRAFEEAQDTANAQACFTQGLSFLNQEAKAARGGVQPDINFSLFGTTWGFPWAN